MKGKTCSKCGQFKELSAFYRNKRAKDGYSYQCKECKSNYNKKYWEDNKEALKEYGKEYRENNREAVLEIKRRYRRNNKDKIKEYDRKRNQTEERKQQFKAKHARRRAMKHALPYTTSAEEWLDIMMDYNCKCAVTGKEPFDLEHAIPLSWGWGGSLKNNIYPMDKSLNCQKSNKNPFKFLKQLKGQQRENFEQVLRNLAKENGLTYKEYRKFVYWCEKHKRTLEEVIEDNKLGLTQIELWKIRSQKPN